MYLNTVMSETLRCILKKTRRVLHHSRRNLQFRGFTNYLLVNCSTFSEMYLNTTDFIVSSSTRVYTRTDTLFSLLCLATPTQSRQSIFSNSMHLDHHPGRPAQLLPVLDLAKSLRSRRLLKVEAFSTSKTSRRRRLLEVEDFSKTSPSRSRRLLEGHLLTGVGDTKPPPATTLPARNTTAIALLLTLKKTSRKSTLITRRIMIEFILVFRQTAVYAYTKKNHIGFILVTRIKALSKQF